MYTTQYSCENNNKYWNNYPHYYSAEGLALRLGIGYEFHIGKHFVIKPAYEMNLGFVEHTGFSSLNINIGWQ